VTNISGSSNGRIKVFETLHLGSNPRPETWAFSLMVKCNVDIVKKQVQFLYRPLRGLVETFQVITTISEVLLRRKKVNGINR
jgi:hypothetical protein